MTRIAAVIVGTDTDRFRRMDANQERIALGKQIAGFTRDHADIALLPAGYLAVKSAVDVKAQARALARIFGDQVLLAGIDELDDHGGDSKSRRAVKYRTAENDEGYHYWAFASKSGALLDEPWRQRSARSGDEVRDATARCAMAGKHKIGVMICGELYNRPLAASLARAAPNMVVDLGHRSMTRFTKSLLRVAETTRCPIFHVHRVALNSSGASKWKATPQGVGSDGGRSWASERKSGGLWAEVKIWNH